MHPLNCMDIVWASVFPISLLPYVAPIVVKSLNILH